MRVAVGRLLRELVRDKANAREFVQADGLGIVVAMMSMVHWSADTDDAHSAASNGAKLLSDRVGADGGGSAALSFFYKNGEGGVEHANLSIADLDAAWEAGELHTHSFVRTEEDREWTPLHEMYFLQRNGYLLLLLINVTEIRLPV